MPSTISFFRLVFELRHSQVMAEMQNLEFWQKHHSASTQYKQLHRPVFLYIFFLFLITSLIQGCDSVTNNRGNTYTQHFSLSLSIDTAESQEVTVVRENFLKSFLQATSDSPCALIIHTGQSQNFVFMFILHLACKTLLQVAIKTKNNSKSQVQYDSRPSLTHSCV